MCVQAVGVAFGILNHFSAHVFATRIDPRALQQMMLHGARSQAFQNLMRHAPGQYQATDSVWLSRIFADTHESHPEVRRGYRRFAKLALLWDEAVTLLEESTGQAQTTSLVSGCFPFHPTAVLHPPDQAAVPVRSV